MIDPRDFLECVVRPTLQHIKLHSLAAEQLVLATGLHESYLTYLRQIGGGPALGVFQIEPATHTDIWQHYLFYRPVLSARVLSLRGGWASTESQLTNNLAYAAAMCRVHYRRDRNPLPLAGDGDEMARCWKRFYNTPLGKGTEAQFMGSWDQYVKPLYEV